MALWEDEKGMTAGDRRVLISRLVAQANEENLKNDEMRIGCFCRTGMLMTLDGSDDDKIKPQGLTIPFVVPEGVDLSSNNEDDNEVDTRTDWDADADDRINNVDNENCDDEADVAVDSDGEE